jgi:hypothetical protein
MKPFFIAINQHGRVVFESTQHPRHHLHVCRSRHFFEVITGIMLPVNGRRVYKLMEVERENPHETTA